MSLLALVNGRVLARNGIESGLAVLVEGRDIVAVVPEADIAGTGAATHDLDGDYLLPGFIDCQVNGGGGVLFNNSPDVEALRRIGAAHRRFGTTGFLPTLISDDLHKMRAAIEATREAIATGVPGVLGIHLEGPYLAPARKGTHDAAKFRIPDAAEIRVATSLDNGCTQPHAASQRGEVGADFHAWRDAQRDRHPDDEQEERKHQVGRRAAVPLRMQQRRVHMTPVARVVDQQHRRDGDAAQRIDRCETRRRGHCRPSIHVARTCRSASIATRSAR